MNLSASSHLSINGLYGSSFETAAGRIGGSGEQSSICAYLRTVCLDTPTSFAMRRQDTPLASRTLIRCCMGVGTVMSFPSRDTCKWLPQLGNLTRPDGPTPLRADNTITWSTFHRQHGQQPRDKPVHKPLNKYIGEHLPGHRQAPGELHDPVDPHPGGLPAPSDVGHRHGLPRHRLFLPLLLPLLPSAVGVHEPVVSGEVRHGDVDGGLAGPDPSGGGHQAGLVESAAPRDDGFRGVDGGAEAAFSAGLGDQPERGPGTRGRRARPWCTRRAGARGTRS